VALEVGASPEADRCHEQDQQNSHEPRDPEALGWSSARPLALLVFEESVDVAGTTVGPLCDWDL